MNLIESQEFFILKDKTPDGQKASIADWLKENFSRPITLSDSKIYVIKKIFF